MERRNFLTAAGILVGQLGLDTIIAGDAAARQVGMSEVGQVQGLTAMYRGADHRYGGAAVYRAVLSYADKVDALLGCSYSERIARSLHPAVADAHKLAGWSCFDAGRHTEAKRQWRRAETIARAAGDRATLADVCWNRHRQARHLGDDRAALVFIRSARELSEGTATPTVMAELWGNEAATLSGLRAAPEAIAALNAAESAFARSDPAGDPPWMRWFTEAEVYAQFASVYRDLAVTDPTGYGPQAVEWSTRAVNGFASDGSTVRSRAMNLIGLASAHLLAREPDGAVTAGRHALADAGPLASRRVHDKLVRLRGLMVPYLHVEGMRELSDDIHEAVTAA